MSDFSHFNRNGEAHMVNVGDKAVTHRTAIAEGWILVCPATVDLIRSGGHKKGDVLGIARIAGIMATKRTADLVPLCHPLSLASVEVELNIQTEPSSAVYCRTRVECHGRTGVEMEALTGVQVALLTVYDMCKAVDRGMTMHNIRLVHKQGGRSGTWTRARSVDPPM